MSSTIRLINRFIISCGYFLKKIFFVMIRKLKFYSQKISTTQHDIMKYKSLGCTLDSQNAFIL